MFLVLEKFEALKSKITIEHSFKGVVAVIVLFILLFSWIISKRSISNIQYQKIQTVIQQQTYPESQKIALELLVQERISVGQYMKLMQVYQYEADRAQQLAPVIAQQD